MDTGATFKLISRETSGQRSEYASGDDRSRGSGAHSNQDQAVWPTRWLCFGEFQLDVKQQALLKDGQPVKVQGKLYQALLALIETPGEIVTRDALRTRLWPRDGHLNYEANVNTTVNKLRQLLGDTEGQSKFIETIPRRGYSFIAKVDYTDEPATRAGSKRAENAERGKLLRSFIQAPERLQSDRAGIWFTASVLALVMAAILFGATVVLYSHRPPRGGMVAHPGGESSPVLSKP
jgi:DNA-binding winged helix-turn-helix (wHTH) protein